MLRPTPTSLAGTEIHQSPYPSDQFSGSLSEDHKMALLTLSHTPLEDQLYRAMLSEVIRAEQSSGMFSVRGLRTLTGINSSSTIRRALAGLLRKLSIESEHPENGGPKGEERFYQIFKPEEIFERRRAFGIPPYPKEIEANKSSAVFDRAIEHIARNNNLSRREAQVALACAEGMTNAEIGHKLSIGEHTVKFHMRNIFTKFGVRRRTELISRLLFYEDGKGY